MSHPIVPHKRFDHAVVQLGPSRIQFDPVSSDNRPSARGQGTQLVSVRFFQLRLPFF